MSQSIQCRFCNTLLSDVFTDLGMSPLANSYVKPERANDMEPFFPLKVYVCPDCFLVQLPEAESPDAIFSDYSYFSSFSDSWLKHAKTYVDAVSERFSIGRESQVVEIASNDGYLLQYFVEKGVPVLGVEPAANVAEVAVKKGIPSVVRFFGKETAAYLASEGKKADLIIGNNVLAHVPNINDFVSGMHILLKQDGVITMEFPHLLQLMRHNQFDTIYHEHYSYLSLTTVEKIFAAHGLRLFDVQEIGTHGGSIRIFATHEDSAHQTTASIAGLKQREAEAGFGRLKTYVAFEQQVRKTKRAMLRFLLDAKEQGKTIVGYGAPAKGNTLLNYCGVGTDFVDYTVDRSPYKQGHLLPGVRIPIYSPDNIRETKPDYVLILPWNIKEEVMEQMAHVREWGGKFVVGIPEVQILA